MTRHKNSLRHLLFNAVRIIWERCAMKHDPYNPNISETEALDFIARHPSLIDALEVFATEASAKAAIAKFINPGYAAGLHYLMATSGMDDDAVMAYRQADPRTEGLLDLSAWEKSRKFWVGLQKGGKTTKAIVEARMVVVGEPALHKVGPNAGKPHKKKCDDVADIIGSYSGRVFGEGGGTQRERRAVLAKAWVEYSTGGAVTAKNIQLQYDYGVLGDDGTVQDPSLVAADQRPKFGGIDFGGG
jgi:hypothetical protein